MPTDSLVPILTAITGLVVGSVGGVVGLVKWLVPRMDAGYKTAIKLQEKHQEMLAAHLVRIAESTERTVEAQGRLAELIQQNTECLGTLNAKEDAHHRDTDVHRAKVDIVLGLSPGGAPRR